MDYGEGATAYSLIRETGEAGDRNCHPCGLFATPQWLLNFITTFSN